MGSHGHLYEQFQFREQPTYLWFADGEERAAHREAEQRARDRELEQQLLQGAYAACTLIAQRQEA